MNNERQGNAENIHYVMEVTLEELYNGAERQVGIQRRLVCDLCRATGSDDHFYECERCSGTGIEMDNRNHPKHMRVTCRSCEGRRETNRCKQCKGMRFALQRVSVDLDVEKGMCDGEKIVIERYGHQNPNMSFGDLIITIHEIEHPIFKRNQNDLSVTMQINFTESLCGFKRALKTLDDRQIIISSQLGKVYVNGDTKYVNHEGMPIYKDPTQRGNLNIHFEVGELPNKIAWKHLATVEKCLPGREISPPGIIDAEECNMFPVRFRHVQRNQHPQDHHPHYQHPQDRYPHDHHPQDRYPHDHHPYNQYSHNEDRYPDDYEHFESDFEVDRESEYYVDVAGKPSSES